jgi:bacterioferritin-associated ferredoxin
MDEQRKQADPTLVCTCNDLYIDDIEAAITEGIVDYVEIMQYNDTLPRCGECDCHVQRLVEDNDDSSNDTDN